jgi:hypothetical protein
VFTSSEKSPFESGSHSCKCRAHDRILGCLLFSSFFEASVSDSQSSTPACDDNFDNLGPDRNYAPSNIISKMTTPIPPLVLSPANIWAGNDGNWSTWAIKVGSSLQSFNILPSTSHGEVWVPGLQGCTSSSTPLLCAESRGVGDFQGTRSLGFQENASSTWEQIGIYEFVTGGDLFQTTETGLYGLDDVVIGEHNTSLEDVTVAGVVTKDFWLGSLGLANVQSEFPVRDESLPSLLDKMKEGNLTSSVSFSLAVGAAYSESPGFSVQYFRIWLTFHSQKQPLAA